MNKRAAQTQVLLAERMESLDGIKLREQATEDWSLETMEKASPGTKVLEADEVGGQ